MDNNSRHKARIEAKAQLLKALGHPTRLMMVERLVAGPLCVCELQELAGSDMSTVSKHLAQLKNVGIVDSEKQGTKVIYSLKCECLSVFLDCIEGLLQERIEGQLAILA